MTGDLITQAKTGDEQAFRQLVEPYERELQVHCYRMLGSVHDAEDAVQETLLAVWRSLDSFGERATLRTWLHRIATRRCLNALRSASRRPPVNTNLPSFAFTPPEPSRHGQVTWLEPYPDLLLDDLPDTAPGPRARYEAREAISLAFITALQLLPPRQRAVLILRDVLGFPVSEAARILDTTQQSAASALKRARATLARQLPSARERAAPPAGSVAERRLAARFANAFEAGDVGAVVALLTGVAWLTMPPVPLEYQGLELADRFLTLCFGGNRRCRRLIATRADGQPAFAVYQRDPHAALMHANGLMALTLADDHICAITRFDNSVLPRFGLPRSLPAWQNLPASHRTAAPGPRNRRRAPKVALSPADLDPAPCHADSARPPPRHVPTRMTCAAGTTGAARIQAARNRQGSGGGTVYLAGYVP